VWRIDWGRLLGKGRLLEPKSPSGQNARLRGGREKETEGVTLVSTRHTNAAISIAALHLISLGRSENG